MNEEYICITADQKNNISSNIRTKLKNNEYYFDNSLSKKSFNNLYNKKILLYSDLLSEQLIEKYKDDNYIKFETKNKGYELGIIAKIFKKEKEDLYKIKEKLFIKINTNEENKNIDNEIEVFKYFGEEMPKYDFIQNNGVYTLFTESVSKNCQDLVQYLIDYQRSHSDKNLYDFIKEKKLVEDENFLRSLIRIMIKSIIFGITDIRSDNLVIDIDSKKLYLVDFVYDNSKDINIITLDDDKKIYDKSLIIGKRDHILCEKKVRKRLFYNKNKNDVFNFFIDVFIASQTKDIAKVEDNRTYYLKNPEEQMTTTLITENSQLLLNILKQINTKKYEKIFKCEFKKIYNELKDKKVPKKYIKNMNKLNNIINGRRNELYY